MNYEFFNKKYLTFSPYLQTKKQFKLIKIKKYYLKFLLHIQLI